MPTVGNVPGGNTMLLFFLNIKQIHPNRLNNYNH